MMQNHIPIKRIIQEGIMFSFRKTKPNFKTVYHGTSPENKRNIQMNGMNINKAGNTPDTVIGILPQNLQDASKNKNYTTTSRFQAAAYAAQHQNGRRVNPTEISPLDTIRNYITGNGIVTMKIPNDFDRKNKIINPEAKDKFFGSVSGVFKDDRVYKKDIPTEYIVGGKNFNENNPKISGTEIPTAYQELQDKALRGRTKRIRKGERILKMSKGIGAGIGVGGIGIVTSKLSGLIESDAPGQYPDTNPFNDPSTIDSVRRNNENDEPDNGTFGQEGEHVHHNPLVAIINLFKWLCYEKGLIDYDPETFSIKAEIGTTISLNILINYLVSKGLILRINPNTTLGYNGYGIAVINSETFFKSMEVEDTLSGQTFHKGKKYLSFKYKNILDLVTYNQELIIELFDPEMNRTYTVPYYNLLNNNDKVLFLN